MVSQAPKYVLLGMDDAEDKDKQIANLKAMVDEREKVAKKAIDDNEKDVKEAAKAIIASAIANEEAIPTVKAKLQAIHDEEKDEAKKAIYKAALDVFDEGNGVQIKNQTQVGETQEEPATKVVEAAIAKAVRPLQEKEMKPIIAQVLKANQISGATADDLQALEKSLLAKSYEEFQTYVTENKTLIAGVLKQEQSQINDSALIAKSEEAFPFNGQDISGALVGNAISIDSALDGASAL